jgi:glutaredoxin-like protein NrdH
LTEITVYIKPDCKQCDLTKALLDRLDIQYDTADIYQHLDHITGLGFRSAPVVETPTGAWAGFRPDLINTLTNRINEGETNG